MEAIPNNENARVCKKCGGECCKQIPGIYAPEQFGAPDIQAMEQNIYDALMAGTAQVDWWDGDPRTDDDDADMRAYYIRPPVRNALGQVFHGSWGGTCALLTAKGCSLAFEKRPIDCQLLVPRKGDKGCWHPLTLVGKNAKQERAIEWLPYADAVEKAAERAKAEKTK